METNNLIRVVNRTLGDRVVYLTTPVFSDISPDFGERMVEEAGRYAANGQSKRRKANCRRGSDLSGGGPD